MTDETRLIQQIKKGNTAAFEELAAGYQKQIFTLAYRMCGNQEDAADMAQEALIKVYRNIDKFKGDSKFSTWLYRVVTNTCLDEMKKMKRKQVYSLDDELETKDGSLKRDIEDTAPTPEEKAEQTERSEAIQDALMQVSETHRKVLVLRDVQGFSYEEIAGMLECSEGTVKSRLSRARESLRNVLKENKELFERFIV